MIRFQHIESFWLLLIIPVMIAIYILWHFNRKKKLEKIGELRLVSDLMPTYSKSIAVSKFVLIMIALFFGIVSLANLQSGARSEKIQRKGIDVMIALDVSKSMLAKDASPDRLSKAKQFIMRLVEKLGNDRIGLVVFAGRAYMSVPLTVDMSALKMNLTTANPDMVPTQGTVIGEAIRMSREAFNIKETKYKSVVLISDGEDHDESAKEEVKKAVEQGVMINTIGVGSPEGSPIWDEEAKQNKKDENGNDIISKLNETELQEIASQGQGVYQHLTNTEAVTTAVIGQINSIEQKSFGDSLFVDYNSYFQYFLIAAIALLLIEFFLHSREKLITA